MATGDFPATALENRVDWGYTTKDNLSNTIKAATTFNIGATSLTLTSSTAFPAQGWILIDSEVCFYTANNTGTGVLTVPAASRGLQGTTEANHSAGTTVYLCDSGGVINRIAIALEAALAKIGINSSAVTSTLDFLAKSATAHATLSVDQSIADSTWTKITFDTETYDVGNNFASNKFTAPVAGKYLVTAGLAWKANATGERGISIYINGAQTYTQNTMANTTGGGHTVNNVSVVMLLAANDYVEIHGVQRSGGALEVDNLAASFFSIALIKL